MYALLWPPSLPWAWTQQWELVMSIRPVMCKCEAGGPALSTHRVERVRYRDLGWCLTHTQLAEAWAACQSSSFFPGEGNVFSPRSFQVELSSVSLGDGMMKVKWHHSSFPFNEIIIRILVVQCCWSFLSGLQSSLRLILFMYSCLMLGEGRNKS